VIEREDTPPKRGPAKQWQSTEIRERDRVRPEGLAQARRWTHPLPAQSPTTPILRANPYPEVTDPICRLPLPTLFYRPEAVNLGDLLRIWVRAGASPPSSPWVFQGPTEQLRMPRELRHSSPMPKPILPARGFQGLGGLCRKDNSSRAFSGRHPVVSRCHDGYENPNGSATRFWNMDQIPFRLRSSVSQTSMNLPDD
jgi:hypothetical protein